MMNPFDDTLPEEHEPQYKELTTLLHQSYSKPVSVTPDRQAQIIARVRERLVHTDQGDSLNGHMPIPEIGGLDYSPSKPVARVGKEHRSGWLVRQLNALAAVLVIGAIVGALLLISMSRPQTTTGTQPIGPVDTSVTIHTQAGGLEASMQLTPGPYFLGELLAADLSVTNHTHTTSLLMRTIYGNPCKGDLGIMMTGGDSPHYTAPSGLDYHISITHLNSCEPSMGLMQAQLEPGHTITIHQYLVITSSGQVTLSAGGTFFTIVGHDNAGHSGNFVVPTASPLDGHWPFLRVDVASRVPPDRMLSLKRQGEQVSVTAPLDARSHLVYESVLHCQYGDGSFSFSGPFYWTSLSTTVLHKVPCSVDNANGMNFPGTFVDWTYAVSAPGYAIAWGRDPS